MKQEYVLGIDIGGTNLRLGLVDKAYQISGFEKLSTQEIFAGNGSATPKLAACIQEYCARHAVQGQLNAISIGFPSTINRERTVVVQTPNINCIPDNYAVVEELAAFLNVPIFINRDVNYLLLYDLEALQVTTQECVAGIYFGTGIGNAIILNGRLLTGRNGAAAELGHLPVYGNHAVCNCGNVSCMETVISGIALETMQREQFPETDIKLMFAQHSDTPQLQAFINGMGQVVATEVNLLDPDCVILGGGLLQMQGFPLLQLEAAVHRFARKPFPEQNLDIRYSHATQQNGVIGAGIYAFKRLGDATYL